MMNNPIFDRADFSLCEIPVPNGYPQSQTHSGIAVSEGRFFLTTSPYPNRHMSKWEARFRLLINRLSFRSLCRDAEVYENPCLFIGSKTKEGPFPTKFKPLHPFPLMQTPKSDNGLPAFNSDPDIFIEKSRCYILNRTVCRTSITKQGYDCVVKIFMIEGDIDKDGYSFKHISQIKQWNMPFASQCLTKYKDKYIFTYLDTNSANDAKTFGGLFLQKLDSLDDLPNNASYKTVSLVGSNMLPWHMSLFSYDSILFTIIACVRPGDSTRKVWQMLGEFNDDLTELTIYPTPLTDYNSYRGAAWVTDDGSFVLYTTTVSERIEGSKSVDGRNVLLATKPFDDLLKRIRGQLD